jgi:hypothetical protein
MGQHALPLRLGNEVGVVCKRKAAILLANLAERRPQNNKQQHKEGV